jgi:hypothetical protein
MAHEEQNGPGPVAQSTSRSPTTSTADLSERDNKEFPVVKGEETNDTEVFEEAVVEVAGRLQDAYGSNLPNARECFSGKKTKPRNLSSHFL